MGNCCKASSSSMEYWDGEDWGSLKSTTRKKTIITTRSSSKVFDEGQIQDNGLCLGKVQKEKLLQRAYPDADGKLKLRISKKDLAELLLGSSGIQNNNNNNNNQGGGASAEQVLFRLINRANVNKRHGPWKPMLECIPESPKLS